MRTLAAATTRDAVAWTVSVGVHAALLAGMMVLTASPVEVLRPELSGRRETIALTAQWVQPRVESAAEAPPLPTRVVVRPEQVEIGRRQFEPAATAVARPEPPTVEHRAPAMAAPLPAERRPRDDAPALEAAPAPLVRQLPAAAPPASAASAALPEAAGSRELEAPEPVHNPPPIYPPEAVRRGWQGTVLLHVEVRSDGTVGQLHVAVSSGHGVLDAAAVRAVRTWRFSPPRRAGQPIAMAVRLPIVFEQSRR